MKIRLDSPELVEIKAMFGGELPPGTFLSLCYNEGKHLNLEGRLWWGYGIQTSLSSRPIFGINLVKEVVKRGDKRIELAKQKEARKLMADAFPSLTF